MIFVLIFIFLIIPLILTVINLINTVFAFINRPLKSSVFRNCDVFSFLVGTLFTTILAGFLDLKDYDVAIQIQSVHAPIASSHILTILVLSVIAMFSYVILKACDNLLPPLIILTLSGLLIGGVISALLIIQLSSFHLLDDFFIGYFALLPINYLLCSAVILKTVMVEYVACLPQKNWRYSNKILVFLSRLATKSRNWPMLAFAMMISIFLVIMLALLPLGQKPDSIIRAFTDTSDWVLSQKTSPPPFDHVDYVD